MAAVAESWYHTDKKELFEMFVVVLALAFAFGWSFEGAATLGNWLGNFVVVLVLVSISVLVHEIVHRLVAKRFQARVHSNIFVSAIVAMILIAAITNGAIVVAVPWAIFIIPLYFYRPGKPYPKWHLGPYETALIAVSGPLASFALAVAAKFLVPVLGLVAEKMIFINTSIALFNLIPFLTFIPSMFSKMTIHKLQKKDYPYVEGEFVFFGSRPLWAFTFVFVLVGSLSLLFLGALASIIIAFIIAATLWFLWHFFIEGDTLPKDIGPKRGASVSWHTYYMDKIHSFTKFEEEKPKP